VSVEMDLTWAVRASDAALEVVVLRRAVAEGLRLLLLLLLLRWCEDEAAAAAAAGFEN
jgi:hypothetical protein